MKDKTTPAFPAPAGVSHITEQGMTLRDYFAAKAMHSLRIEDAILHNEDCDFSTIDEIAESAYSQANAMLKARGE
jgi:hypothetical protein